MTPLQKLKWAMLQIGIEQYGFDLNELCEGETGWTKDELENITADNVDDLYEAFRDDMYDLKNEFREGDVETKLPCEYSRNYESKSVAAKIPDGSWVGWTYWYGGGKHGEPEAIGWMENAYDLNVAEEEKMVIVRTFTKK